MGKEDEGPRLVIELSQKLRILIGLRKTVLQECTGIHNHDAPAGLLFVGYPVENGGVLGSAANTGENEVSGGFRPLHADAFQPFHGDRVPDGQLN